MHMVTMNAVGLCTLLHTVLTITVTAHILYHQVDFNCIRFARPWLPLSLELLCSTPTPRGIHQLCASFMCTYAPMVWHVALSIVSSLSDSKLVLSRPFSIRQSSKITVDAQLLRHGSSFSQRLGLQQSFNFGIVTLTARDTRPRGS